MPIQWTSKKLYEHPAPHQAGTYGRVLLFASGIYGFKVGGSHMSCPPDWAARVQADEERGEESEASYILKGIPESLWTEVKVKAVREGRTIKDVLLILLQKYIAE